MREHHRSSVTPDLLHSDLYQEMITILKGDCRDLLPALEAESIQCCVTSPPYWGLRDYGTATWEGGDAGCDHSNIRRDHGDEKQSTQNGSSRDKVGRECRFCGARRIDAQLGLESTPEEYVASMVGVFREVWRVLRDDGTLWINLGDTYGGWSGATNHIDRATNTAVSGLKPKDLCGIPWRVAFALQADGWYLRSDIIWHKPNPMPESVNDRPTKAHEYLFLLTKQERYFYDADAIRERTENMYEWQAQPYKNGNLAIHHRASNPIIIESPGYRNKRSVWTIATQPYTEAHFATFPEDLVKPCILAGSRAGDFVLDPFAGSGTTGQVALELGRSALLIELSPDYCQLARDRTNVTPGFVFT
jgi:DNA modification methylase